MDGIPHIGKKDFEIVFHTDGCATPIPLSRRDYMSFTAVLERFIHMHLRKYEISVVRILESLEKVSILNRACRTLANLALDVQNAEEIHKKEASKSIINLLLTQQDGLFRQSAIRALRCVVDFQVLIELYDLRLSTPQSICL